MPKFSRTEGKAPAFSTEEVQKVFASIDTSHVVGHRDKAFLAILAYTFARIGAVVNLKVEDYLQAGKRPLIRFKEKGGKEKEIPVHHKLEEILDTYLRVSRRREKPDTPLFATTLGKSLELGSRLMARFDGANLLKRRLKDAGIEGDYFPPFFQGYRYHQLPGERGNSGGGSADCRPC
jgi:integrase/recombinase XerD